MVVLRNEALNGIKIWQKCMCLGIPEIHNNRIHIKAYHAESAKLVMASVKKTLNRSRITIITGICNDSTVYDSSNKSVVLCELRGRAPLDTGAFLLVDPRATPLALGLLKKPVLDGGVVTSLIIQENSL